MPEWRGWTGWRSRGAVALVAALAVLSACSGSRRQLPGFRELVEELSEEDGYFDTDNLISNEGAYIQVIPQLTPVGGVYIGVGPEQNFHYIGRLRPRWAFILDVRRDNLLHHLLLNALLAKSETPFEYLCRLFSRRCEAVPPSKNFPRVVAAVEGSDRDGNLFARNLDSVLEHIQKTLGFSMDGEDRKVIEFIYRSFFDEQLGLRFESHGRPPMPYHPSYRALLLAEGPDGKPAHFLSRPEDYDHVRRLATEGRLVPIVGDFAGPHALRAVGKFAREQGEKVTAFYVSNVEFYLIRSGIFPSYVDNVRSLPVSESSQFIRAYFSYGYPHPAALPGQRSTLVRQKIDRFLDLYDRGAYADYWDVSTLDYER
ncbi:MAG: hypothetical protein ACRD21_10035 [Vicinamibacteria bacterium]